MEDQRFDELTRKLATPISRRQAFKAIVATALGGLLIRSGSGTAWASTSDCAHFCTATFGGDTAAQSQCASDGAHAKGLCYSACGPNPPAGTSGALCGAQSGGNYTSYAGTTCCVAGSTTCLNNACCTPATSCAAGQNCGTISNGCGGTLNCGTCTAPQTCGGGGTPNACGCTPTTCAAQLATCGTISNRCGGTLNCGTCASGICCSGSCLTCAVAGDTVCCSATDCFSTPASVPGCEQSLLGGSGCCCENDLSPISNCSATLPCCGQGIRTMCQAGHCCVLAGNACSGNQTCCSGTCGSNNLCT